MFLLCCKLSKKNLNKSIVGTSKWALSEVVFLAQGCDRLVKTVIMFNHSYGFLKCMQACACNTNNNSKIMIIKIIQCRLHQKKDKKSHLEGFNRTGILRTVDIY